MSPDGAAAPLGGAFTETARLDAPAARVFAAFRDEPVRRRWFRQPGDRARQTYVLDFRVGGREIATTVFAMPDREEHVEYASTFFDLVPDERIVLSYSVRIDDVLRWAALRTIGLSADGAGTQLEWTEQYRFFALTDIPAHDVAHLEGSTRLQLNGLAAVLADTAPAASGAESSRMPSQPPAPSGLS